MQAAPGYLSAERLLETVWDANADPFTKTVAVTIGSSGVGRVPSIIETAKGVSLRIVD